MSKGQLFLVFVIVATCFSSYLEAEEHKAKFKIGEIGLEGEIRYEDTDNGKLHLDGKWGYTVLGVPLHLEIKDTLGKNKGGSFEYIHKSTIEGVGVKHVFYFEPKPNGFRFVGRFEGDLKGKRQYVPGPDHKKAVTADITW